MKPQVTGDSWDRLPRRVYLDTSALQTIHDYSEYIFDGVPPTLSKNALRVNDLDDQIWALAAILELGHRGAIQFAVTGSALAEVSERGIEPYTTWVTGVAAHWRTLSPGSEIEAGNDLDDPKFGMISLKDKSLLQEALNCKCHAFITMERRLPKTSPFLQRTTGLRILRPTEHWGLLRPWAALFR